jgi:hypothetical protein
MLSTTADTLYFNIRRFFYPTNMAATYTSFQPSATLGRLYAGGNIDPGVDPKRKGVGDEICGNARKDKGRY